MNTHIEVPALRNKVVAAMSVAVLVLAASQALALTHPQSAAAATLPSGATDPNFCADYGRSVGGSFDGVEACTPTGSGTVSFIGNGGTRVYSESSPYGFQCVELSVRYLYKLGYGALGENGVAVVSHYANTYHLPMASSAAGQPMTSADAVRPGNVLSLAVSSSDTVGHTAIVTRVTGTPSSGTITMLSENAPTVFTMGVSNGTINTGGSGSNGIFRNLSGQAFSRFSWLQVGAPANTRSGLTAITSVTSGGYVTASLKVYFLYGGWRSFVREPGNGLELLYNPSNGLADSVAFDKAGNWSLRWTRTISAGWTNIVPLGNGYVVFYNATTGLTATGVFNSSGALTTLTPGGFHLNPGWSSVTAVGYGTGVMFYNVNTGVTCVGYLDSAGHYHQVEAQTQSSGWATVTNVQNLTTFYNNPSTGLSAVTVWNSTTRRLDTVAVYRISTGWTQIAPTNTGGIWLFYNASSGLTAAVRFNASGTLTTVTPGGYHTSPGWTSIAPLATGSELFYTA